MAHAYRRQEELKVIYIFSIFCLLSLIIPNLTHAPLIYSSYPVISCSLFTLYHNGEIKSWNSCYTWKNPQCEMDFNQQDFFFLVLISSGVLLSYLVQFCSVITFYLLTLLPQFIIVNSWSGKIVDFVKICWLSNFSP